MSNYIPLFYLDVITHPHSIQNIVSMECIINNKFLSFVLIIFSYHYGEIMQM